MQSTLELETHRQSHNSRRE